MTTPQRLNEQLPSTGYMRLPAILHFIPIGRSTWWKWVSEGKAPKPVKLGTRTTAWRAEDIKHFIEHAGEGVQPGGWDV